MAYTTIDDPSAYFQTKLYTGTNNELVLTFDGNSNLQPDMIWTKNRSRASTNHVLSDTVRGIGKGLYPDLTNAEGDTNYISAIGSNGYTIVATDSVEINRDDDTFVSWNWKAGTAFTNDASATGVGSIDSSGSVNTDAGFSIVSFTATGSAGTIKHGLSTAPKMIIVKCRGASSTWSVYHASLGATKFLRLEDTSAVGTETGWWNDTAPTSSVFTIGGNHSANTQIAYCFAEKQGYSKFGSYIGNGNASGPYIFTGHKPAAIIIKRTDTAKNWYINDNLREGYNNDNPYISPNLDVAETGGTEIDILSNGFRITASGTGHNQSGGTYMYASIAENPFVTSTGIPATAR